MKNKFFTQQICACGSKFAGLWQEWRVFMLVKKLKKIACTTLCTSMALTNFGTGIPEITAVVSASDTNILDNASFRTDTGSWFATTVDTAKLEFINDGKGYDNGSGYVKVTERSDTWNSLAQDIKNKVKNKTKYNFSCWLNLVKNIQQNQQ